MHATWTNLNAQLFTVKRCLIEEHIRRPLLLQGLDRGRQGRIVEPAVDKNQLGPSVANDASSCPVNAASHASPRGGNGFTSESTVSLSELANRNSSNGNPSARAVVMQPAPNCPANSPPA